MNEQQSRETLIQLWLQKAEEAMSSAKLELDAGHTNFAVNRLYYACFYAVTALLLKDTKQFARHSAVKSEFVHSYIKAGKIDIRWNGFYQKLFDDRQEVDYLPTIIFESADVLPRLHQAREFLDTVRALIAVN
jgi:uncharacterized protein (UPF0332 family)